MFLGDDISYAGHILDIRMLVKKMVEYPNDSPVSCSVSTTFSKELYSLIWQMSRNLLSLFFKSSGGCVKIKLKLPHFHVSDTCVSI